jgi:ParB family chromosome partitioning protein
MNKEWVVRAKQLCNKYKVPFFFKQWGVAKNNPDPNDPTIHKAHRYHAKGGCMLDGKLYQANPTIEDDSVPMIKLFGSEYFIMDEAYDLNTIWELKSYLPMMDEDLLAQLTKDIKKNGVNDPILYWVTPEGKKLVIEGHTRLTAAISARKKDVPTKEIKEDFTNLDDIKLWMIKHQFQRRNLSSLERIELAYHSKETIEKAARENLSKAGKGEDVNNAIDTYDEIAKLAGVGRTSVVRYSGVVNKASESLVRKMRNGEVSINAAYNKIKEEEPVKPIKKTQAIEPSPTIVTNIERAMKMLGKDEVEAVLIIKDKAYIDTLSKQQKKKFAFLKMDNAK